MIVLYDEQIECSAARPSTPHDFPLFKDLSANYIGSRKYNRFSFDRVNLISHKLFLRLIFHTV